MAQNVFSMSPVDWATQAPLGAKPDQQPEQQQSNPIQLFEDVARKHGVGVNVLLALESEAGGDFKDLDAAVRRADARAAQLAEATAGGAAPRDALRSYLDGDPDRARSVGHLANQITADLYPDRAQERSLMDELGTRAARGLTSIPAGALEGKAVGDAERDRMNREAAAGISEKVFQAELAKMEEALKGRLTPQQRQDIERDIAVTKEKIAQVEAYSQGEVLAPEERGTFKAGQELRWDSEGVFGTPDPEKEGLIYDLAEGAGNMAGFIATAIAGATVGGGVGGFAATGYAGAQLNKSDIYKEARAAGLDVEQATSAANIAEMLGATEAVPIMTALRYLPAPLRRRVTNRLARRLVEIGVNATEEAVQEAVVGIGNNLIARGFYDPERGIMEGVPEQALVGAILGGAVNVGAQGVDKLRGIDRFPELTGDAETPGADGTASGQAPAGSPEAGAGEGPVGAAPPPEPPRGPIEAAAQDAPPPVQPEPEPAAYEPLYPDLKPGKAVRLTDFEGKEYEATYLGEKADEQTGHPMVDVRVGGQRFSMTPQEFEEARQKRAKTEPDDIDASTANDIDDLSAGMGGIGGGIADGYYTMLMKRFNEGKTTDASGATNPALEIAQRVKARGGVVDQPTMREIARQAQSIADSGLSGAEYQQAMRDLVDQWAPEQSAAPETSEPAADTKKPDLKPSEPTEPVQIEAPTPVGGVITRRDGTPFGDQKSAARAMMKRGLPQNEYYIEPVEGGFVVKRREPEAQEETEAQTEEPDAATDVVDDADTDVRDESDAEPEQTSDSMLDDALDEEFGAEADDQVSEGDNEGGPVATGEEADAVRRSAIGRAKRKLKQAVMAREKRLAEPSATPDDVTRLAGPVREARDQLASLIGDEAADDYWSNLDQAGADRFQQVQLPAVPDAEAIDNAAQETDPNPTEAQKEAENYKTGKTPWQGLTLSIENRKGSERSGTGPDGETWSVTMPAHYGRILLTEGADGDHVDFYMGEYPDSEKVWVIDQKDAETDLFDEHKAMLGFKSKRAALKAHRDTFSDGKGKERQGGSVEMTVAEFKDWLENGDQSKPAVQKQGGRKKPAVQKQGGRKKVEDFGEKIGGARKDSAKKFVDDLDADQDTESMTLAQAFPEPDYEALVANDVPKENAAAIAVVRAAIPRKPAKTRRHAGWARSVDEARRLASRLAADKLPNGDTFAEQLVELLSRDSVFISPNEVKNELLPMIEVVRRLDPQWFGRAARDFAVTRPTNYDAKTGGYLIRWVVGKNLPANRVAVVSESNRYGRDKLPYIAEAPALDNDNGETVVVEAARMIANHYELEAEQGGDRKPAPIEFEIRGPLRRAPWRIYIKKPRVMVVPGLEDMKFSDYNEAKAYVENNREELEQRVRDARKGPNERLTTSRDRKGPSRRKGDVTPEMFTSELGFRGVTFGNNLTINERQERMNLTYDAMMDLAGVLGVPVKTLSLNGRLGLGFGSHGKGGKGHWAAVYIASGAKDEDQVIALTKNQGAGSLAHEWFHGVDNFLAREAGLGHFKFASDLDWRQQGDLSDSEYAALQNLKNVLWKSDHRLRMAQIDKYQNKKPPYWSSVVEMAARAFERMVVERLYTRDMHNDFLANPDLKGGAYMTPTEIRRAGVAEAFDEVLSVLSNRLGVEGGTVPDMPDVIEDRVNRAPGVGFQWESPEGWRELTDYKPGTGDNEQFEITDKKTGKKRWVPANTVEDVIEGDAVRMTPEYQEAQKEKEAAKAAAQEAAEKRREEAEPYIEARKAAKEKAAGVRDAFARATGKKPETVASRLSKSYRWEDDRGGDWHARRDEMIVYAVENDHARRYIYKDSVTSLGLEFFEWYKAEWQRQEAARQAAEEANATPASEDADDLLNAALDEEFGGESDVAENEPQEVDGPVSPDKVASIGKTFDEAVSQEPVKKKEPANKGPERTAGEAGASAVKNVGEGIKDAVSGLNKLFGGDDPTMMSAGLVFNRETYEKAKPHFIAAIRAFGQAGQDIADMVRAMVKGLRANGLDRQAVENMRPYLVQFIDDLKSGEINPFEEGVANTGAEENISATIDADAETVTAGFLEAFRDGEGFGTIVQARKKAGELVGRKIEVGDYLWIEEAIESAVVRRARELVDSSSAPRVKMQALTDLYQQQPRLNERTPDKMIYQAYSTPAPLAYVASRLAGIGKETRVYEPTAGNGMLLLESTPSLSQANELQASRAAQLGRNLPGVVLTSRDGTTHKAQPFDALIANPPFGPVKDENGVNRKWPLGEGTTTQIDHAIAWATLEQMPEDGRAVLIVGSVKKQLTGDDRKKAYQEQSKSRFYKNVYDNYNVVDHFTVAGELYSRQGAAWPVDVIVVDGKGASSRDYPMKTPPDVLSTWDEVGRKLDDAPDVDTTGRGTDLRSPDVQQADDPGAVSGTAGGAAGGGDLGGDPAGRPGTGEAGVVGGERTPGGRGSDATGVGDGGRPGQSGVAPETGDGDISGRAGSSDTDGRPGAKPASDNANPDASRDRVTRENTEVETEYQVQYNPHSSVPFAVGTLVPTGMRDAINGAIAKITEEHGDLDAYVAEELGYTQKQLGQNFSAEQVDALAMAISQIGSGNGFIIGDQTGVGKGRVVAGMLRYAKRKGFIPVFVTENPGLYSDMIRDLRDIGELPRDGGTERIMVTNEDNTVMGKLQISGPKDLFNYDGKDETKSAIGRLRRQKKLPKGKDFLFTTYTQLQYLGEKKGWPNRVYMARDIADRAMFVMDESHNAGGSSQDPGKRYLAEGEEDTTRATLFRELIDLSNNRVFYSSATYAKNPNVMDLYRATNLRFGVEKIDDLAKAIAKGGVPLQQIIANALTSEGQYIRRERSFDGVAINPVQLETKQTETYEIAATLAAMARFDVETMEGVRETAMAFVREEGEITTADGAVGVAGTSSANFTSTAHNLISQFLLSVKLVPAVDKAVEAWKAGEKPILTLMNTNETILTEEMVAAGASVGQQFDLPLKALMKRYLKRLRQFKIKLESKAAPDLIRYITDEEMGASALSEYEAVEAMIDALPDGLSGSPIDTLLDRMRNAGMKVDEISGRHITLTEGILQARKSGAAENKSVMNAFNRGDLDALILTASGSTGFSLHAMDAENNDGKKRRMMVLQPHHDITRVIQTFGRVHRTGQSQVPEYDIFASDLAIEKRPLAVLMKKLASLNANTTAGKRSAFTMDNVVDFVNEVGDLVVRDYLREDEYLALRLGLGGKVDAKEASAIEGLAQKMTGLLAFVPPDEAARHFEAIEEAYAAKIAQLDEQGINPLEAKYLDFEAKTINSWVIEEGSGSGSSLDGDMIVEQALVKKLGRPYRAERVRELVDKTLEGSDPREFMRGVESDLRGQLPNYLQSLETLAAKRDAEVAPLISEVEAAEKAAQEAANFSAALERRLQEEGGDEKQLLVARKEHAQAERHAKKKRGELAKARKAAQSARDQIEAKKALFNDVWQSLSRFAPGSAHTITLDNETDLTGVVIGVDTSKTNGNPAAAGRIMVRFAVTDATPEKNVPLSQIMNETGMKVAPAYPGFDPYPFFDAGQSEARETRFIATGNLLRAFSRFEKVRGQAVFYSTDSGEVRTGMLMPGKFDLKKELGDQDVSFPDVETAAQFLRQQVSIVKDSAKVVQIRNNGSGFSVVTPVAKGKAFFKLQAVQPYIEDFRQQGKNYQGQIAGENLENVLRTYSDNLGVQWVTDSYKDEARKLLGIDLPDPDEPTPRMRKARGPRTPAMGEAVEALNSVLRTLDIPASRLRVQGQDQVYLDGQKVHGWYQAAEKAGVIAISLNVDPTTTLNHEVIHFLRDPKVWGREYGIFTRKEWRTLVKAAQANTRIMREVKQLYPEASRAIQLEEAVAEMYAIYRRGETVRGAQRVLVKIEKFFHALSAALRGMNIREAWQLMDALSEGKMRSRYRNEQGQFTTPEDGRRARRVRSRAGRMILTGSSHWKKAGEYAKEVVEDVISGDTLTDRMSGTLSALSLVPGRALFMELGKRLPAAKVYQRLKEEMDALRNEWHARTDKVVQDWMKLRRSNTEANARLMDLMHRSTLAGIDPSAQFQADPELQAAYNFIERYGEDHPGAGWARRKIANHEARREAYDILRAEWDQLPPQFQRMYRKLLREYSDMADRFEDAVAENIRNATRIAAKRAERAHERELQRISDEGLTGAERDDAINRANVRLQQARARAGWATSARIGALRQKFEENRLKGPYFPLARFGDYYITMRDPQGKVVSFSLFEKAGKQRREIQRLRREYPDHTIEHGVMSERKDLSSDVDPTFVADVQALLGDADADAELMDAVWQRWLETLPDYSIRTSRIHRKGREGYSQDAMRAYSSHMFHGAHQLARLQFGLKMLDSLDDAEKQAENSDAPERNMKAVNEMRLRHDFAMAPTGSPLAAGMTQLAFIWYLGATPAAGIVNLTQTTVVGIPVLKAGFQDVSVTKIAGELTRAAGDFLRDPDPESYADTLTADEKAAMQEAYRRGTISKTQAHELAQVAETGVEYSGVREKWMKRISFFFHHAERANREITFLAAYRLARDSGAGQSTAINKAADLTWKTHFDYQNTARPRIMQNDWMKIFTIFRQFTVNMLWRLFRDSHQALKGATAAERREARTQLIGITLSMAAHAGITGVWGWGLAMTLSSLFFEGDDEDMEARLQDALLLEGDSTGVAAWNYIMGMALKGVPGHVAGVNMTDRIGMPDLWFRGSNRDLEGTDLYNHWVGELLGPLGGIGESFFRAADYALGGDWWRAFESATPKFINDVSQAVRYGTQGVTTRNGDPIIEDITPYQAIVQAIGFTPAQVSERYAANSRMINAQNRIQGRRSDILRDAYSYVEGGKPIPQSVLDDIYEYNAAYPEFPITRKTIERSFSSRAARSARGEFGVVLNPRLNLRIREGAGQLLYE